jgi:hypothetical protein
MGWIRTMSDSGQILGPLVMGALADSVDLSAPFLFGAALLAATAWQCRRRASLTAVTSAGQRPESSAATDRVLVMAAHPDDPEFLPGGTVGRFAKEGREVGLSPRPLAVRELGAAPRSATWPHRGVSHTGCAPVR